MPLGDIAPIGAPDGYVDDADLSVVLANWHTSGPEGDIAPIDAPNGFVDDADLSVVLANWHAGLPPPPGPITPEPATLSLLVIGALALACRRIR